MDTNDKRAIETLFSKLESVGQQAPARDTAAEAFIRDEISRQPTAPYYMAQTIIVQEQALEAAQRRIEELETRETQPQGGGGLLGGLFGGDRTPSRRPAGAVPRTGGTATGASKWGSGAPGGQQDRSNAGRGMGGMAGMGGGMGGGGFLAGAAQTAMGVAGGVLLGNAIAGMFNGNEAQAADASQADAANEPEADAQDAGVEEASFDDGGFEDSGFDGGDFGDI